MADEYMMRRADGTRVSVDEAARIALSWILEAPGESYELVIGTDSQSFEKKTRMIEVVVVRRIGRGGIFFYHPEEIGRMDVLRAKIYEETARSLSLAGRFIPAFHDAMEIGGADPDALDVAMAVHCDVGPAGGTRPLVREIAGWVEAEGYRCLIKPDSYAATGVANRYSK